ncbi:MAG: hypothetical protein LBT68_01270 [Spirochaetales bacterium]|jgi:tetratricopeptide (TPR) repeat protein|nr:hypothetical protein [Spirochaetales bacterium]
MGFFRNVCALTVLALTLASGCSGGPDAADSGAGAGASGGVQKKAPAAPAGPYYEGDGAKGVVIAVLAPQAQNLSAADTAWLPLFVQGKLTEVFKNFSAMTVVDRQNDAMIKAEQLLSETGYYSDKNAVEIGNMTNAQYILAGTLISKGGGAYTLQTAVANPSTGERVASGSTDCTAEQLNNAWAVNEAAAALLTGMKVQLTEEGRQALRDSSAASQTAIAKGIAAQKSGTLIEALAYYNDAAVYDPSSSEAASRLQAMSAQVSSGDIKQQSQYMIEREEAVERVIKEAADYYRKNPPYEIVYTPSLHKGNIDYASETVQLGFYYITQVTDGFRGVYKDINKMFPTTGAAAAREIFGLRSSYSGSQNFYKLGLSPEFTAELLDEAGKVIAKEKVSANLFYVNHSWWGGSGWGLGSQVERLRFRVNADDITDKLSIRINGIPSAVSEQDLDPTTANEWTGGFKDGPHNSYWVSHWTHGPEISGWQRRK